MRDAIGINYIYIYFSYLMPCAEAQLALSECNHDSRPATIKARDTTWDCERRARLERGSAAAPCSRAIRRRCGAARLRRPAVRRRDSIPPPRHARTHTQHASRFRCSTGSRESGAKPARPGAPPQQLLCTRLPRARTAGCRPAPRGRPLSRRTRRGGACAAGPHQGGLRSMRGRSARRSMFGRPEHRRGRSRACSPTRTL
jgi:hypothetical protein